jgi:hypothetical protein
MPGLGIDDTLGFGCAESAVAGRCFCAGCFRCGTGRGVDMGRMAKVVATRKHTETMLDISSRSLEFACFE